MAANVNNYNEYSTRFWMEIRRYSSLISERDKLDILRRARYWLKRERATWLWWQSWVSLSMPLPGDNGPTRFDPFGLSEQYQQLLQRHYEQGLYAECCDIIKDSIIIEWPKQCAKFIVDQAPLVHKARDSSRDQVRSDLPTMQVRVMALDGKLLNVKTARFSACLMVEDRKSPGVWIKIGSLRKLTRQGDKQKLSRQLVYEQSESNNHWLSLAFGADTPNQRFQYFTTYVGDSSNTASNGSGGYHFTKPHDGDGLCASFIKLGIELGPERQVCILNRYCIYVWCSIDCPQLGDQPIVKELFSHPFRISKYWNIHYEEEVGDIAWEILQQYETNHMDTDRVRWSSISRMLRHFPQCQLIGDNVRTLDDAELLHLQCMLFLPTVNEHQMPNNDADYRRLFDVDDADLPPGRIDRHAIRAELLRRPVRDDLLVSKEQFLSDKCVSFDDGANKLEHSFWSWFFNALVVLLDRDPNRMLCPDPQSNRKRRASLMPFLFNNNVISMRSQNNVWQMFKAIHRKDQRNKTRTCAIMMRFDENQINTIHFSFSNLRDGNLKPTVGTASVNDLRKWPFGLLSFFRGPYPSQFDRLVKVIDGMQSDSNQTKHRLRRDKTSFVPISRLLPLPPSKQERGFETEFEHDPYYGPSFLSDSARAYFAKDPPDVECTQTVTNTTNGCSTITEKSSLMLPVGPSSFTIDTRSVKSQFTVPSSVMTGLLTLCINKCATTSVN